MTTYTEQEMQDIAKRMMENLMKETEDSKEKNARPPDFENITRIPDFRYDKDAGNTFKSWFERYRNSIRAILGDDTARARFVTSKLETDKYNQFANRIIPRRIIDLEYTLPGVHEEPITRPAIEETWSDLNVSGIDALDGAPEDRRSSRGCATNSHPTTVE